MKKNNLDDYINTLKPLAEQAPVPPRNLPMRLKKKKEPPKLARYFTRFALGAVCLFFAVFIFTLIRSNTRPSVTAMSIQEEQKTVAPSKKISKPVVKTEQAAPATQVTTPSQSVVSTASASNDIATPAKAVSAAPPNSHVTAKTPPVAVQEAQTVPLPAPKPTVAFAAPPKPDVAVKNPPAAKPTVTQTTKATQQIARTQTRKEMVFPRMALKPYKWTPPVMSKPQAVVAKTTQAAATNDISKEEKAITKPLDNSSAKNTQLNRTEANTKPAKSVAAKNENTTRTLAAVTKQTAVIEKPVITEPVVEKPRKIPYSKQVAGWPIEQRLAKAKELFDQQQWYDACDIYRKEMYNAGLNKSRRHEVVIRTAQCYYKLGYKSTADHLLDAVVNEGGSMKKEAKAVLEAHK